jgi:hypothetical protein
MSVISGTIENVAPQTVTLIYSASVKSIIYLTYENPNGGQILIGSESGVSESSFEPDNPMGPFKGALYGYVPQSDVGTGSINYLVLDES